MTLDELIAEARDYIRRNTEPGADPGNEEIRVQSIDGTFESVVVSFESANTPWLIVEEPDYSEVS